MEKHKYNVGDTVICINGTHGCDTIVNKKCEITKILTHPDGTLYNIQCDGTHWLVSESQIQLAQQNTQPSDCLTDPDIDYEKISENPVYFEFVDIGKALNKLKDYEHSLMSQVRAIVTGQEKYAIRYVIGSRGSSTEKIFTGCITAVSGDTVSIKFEDGTVAPFHKNRVYTTYTDALENFKRFHKT